MKSLSLAIALATLMAVSVVTQCFAEYWIATDWVGMPTVTDRKPADSVTGVRGPFKYLDEAIRDMGTGTQWGHRCYITGQCTSATRLGR